MGGGCCFVGVFLYCVFWRFGVFLCRVRSSYLVSGGSWVLVWFIDVGIVFLVLECSLLDF